MGRMSVESLLDGRTIYLWAPIAAANVPLTCTALLDRPSSTASIRNSIFAPCWPRSRTIPSAASRNSCPGTSSHLYRPNPPKPLRHTQQVSTKKKWTLQEMKTQSSQEGNSGRLRWRATRQGIAGWRLIDADERREWARLPLPAFSFHIGSIDFPMPRKTHPTSRRVAASMF